MSDSPQSFAHVLAEADGGMLNKQLSEEWQQLQDALDNDSMVHERIAKGAIVIKLVVSNDRGKVLILPEIKLTLPKKERTGARFFRTEDGELTTQDPRVVGDLFTQARINRTARGAPPPKAKGEGG